MDRHHHSFPPSTSNNRCMRTPHMNIMARFDRYLSLSLSTKNKATFMDPMTRHSVAIVTGFLIY